MSKPSESKSELRTSHSDHVILILSNLVAICVILLEISKSAITSIKLRPPTLQLLPEATCLFNNSCYRSDVKFDNIRFLLQIFNDKTKTSRSSLNHELSYINKIGMQMDFQVEGIDFKFTA